MKNKILLIFIMGFIKLSVAQQEPLFTMYWNNYSLQNPAATALFSKHFASVSGRRQWTGLTREPQTISAVYEYGLTKINSGIGINYFNDQLGLERSNKININYCYQILFNNSSVLSTGIGLGLLQKTIDYSLFVFPNAVPDPLLPSGKINDNLFNLNLGTMYKTNRFLIGFSVTQLNEAKSERLNFQNVRQYFLTSSYKIGIGKNFDLKPGFYFRSDLSVNQADVNLTGTYRQFLSLGISYRSSDAIAGIIMIDIKNTFRLGYSYDYTTSALKNYSSGSHEIILALSLK